ncbi:unnamed protein product [Closterium sp. NIES-53]
MEGGVFRLSRLRVRRKGACSLRIVIVAAERLVDHDVVFALPVLLARTRVAIVLPLRLVCAAATVSLSKDLRDLTLPLVCSTEVGLMLLCGAVVLWIAFVIFSFEEDGIPASINTTRICIRIRLRDRIRNRIRICISFRIRIRRRSCMHISRRRRGLHRRIRHCTGPPIASASAPPSLSESSARHSST